MVNRNSCRRYWYLLKFIRYINLKKKCIPTVSQLGNLSSRRTVVEHFSKGNHEY